MAIEFATSNLQIELSALMDHLGPRDARSAFVSVVMGAAANMPEEKWKAMMIDADKGCGSPGCDCEKVTGPMMALADKLRAEFVRIATETEKPTE